MRRRDVRGRRYGEFKHAQARSARTIDEVPDAQLASIDFNYAHGVVLAQLMVIGGVVTPDALAKRLAGFMASPLERPVGRHFRQHPISISLQLCSLTV